MKPDLDPYPPLFALLVSALNPLIVQFIPVLVFAVLGALVVLSKKDNTLKGIEALGFMFRAVCFSVVFAGIGAYLLSGLPKMKGVPIIYLASGTSFVIAIVGDRWLELIDKGWERVVSLVARGKTS